MKVKEELSNLKETDIYSLMMFVLYKMIDIPEYSSISELAFILDKDNLLKLCEYYGGTTIKIPTIQDLESIVNLIFKAIVMKMQSRFLEAVLQSSGLSSRIT